MPRVIDFEIPTDDVERITKFYTTVFGWKVEKWKGPVDHWFLVTGDDSEPGINGSFAKRGDFPEGTTVNVIDSQSRLLSIFQGYRRKSYGNDAIRFVNKIIIQIGVDDARDIIRAS
jgi:catechol 2,3-dioxygenase-like lactoylglutathione lyase family enzyme